MNIKELKDHALELAQKLAVLRLGSPAYKKLLDAARKQYKAILADEDYLDLFIHKAETYAADIQDDRAAGQSLARMAPMETIQGRMERLLAEVART